MSYATYANVEAAIQTLQARGEKITTRAVRQELGGGSLEDIAALISQVLMGEPIADESPALPSLPYDLPEPDPDIIQRHLAQLEGEAQALALIDHLQELVNSARCVQLVGDRAAGWLFQRVTQLGERSRVNLLIGKLGEDLREVTETAEAMLARTRREYARINPHNQEEVRDAATTATESQ